QLQEAGKLSVNDPVVKYLPEYRTPNADWAAATTIEHFMTHTAGLPPLPALEYAMARSQEGDPALETEPDDVPPHDPIDTYEELLSFIAEGNYELVGAPGQQFSYSNDGYALLGLIIERVSGMSFADYVVEQILRPAGMTRSGFDLAALRQLGNITSLFSTRPVTPRPDAPDAPKREPYEAPIWQEAPAMVAAGFMRSTVRDLIRYLEIFRTGGTVDGVRILSAASVAAMTHPHVFTDAGRYYGYGLTVVPNFHGLKIVSHGGSLKGVAAQVTVLPEAGLSGAALSNLASVSSDRFLQPILNGLLGLPLEQPVTEFLPSIEAPSADALAAYAGTYSGGEGQKIEIRVNEAEDGLLFVVEEEQYPARPTSGRHLFAVDIEGRQQPLTFFVDANGVAQALFWGRRVIRRRD
ncbi:MAG: beta-lactamase family protein, partial [Alicyclobacillus sp.]|nr:beta-lactamase family protein [Alicyclobacillus sp.]